MKILLLILLSMNLFAGELTLYYPSGKKLDLAQKKKYDEAAEVYGPYAESQPKFRDPSQWLRLSIDGKDIGRIRNWQKFTMQIPDGKHMIRAENDLNFSTVIEVKGNYIMRIMDGAGIPWTEILLCDQLAKDELGKCDQVSRLED